MKKLYRYTGASGSQVENRFGTWDTSKTDPKHPASCVKELDDAAGDALLSGPFVAATPQPKAPKAKPATEPTAP